MGVGTSIFVSVVFFALFACVWGFVDVLFQQRAVAGGVGWELIKLYSVFLLGFQHLLGLYCYGQQAFHFLSLSFPPLPLSDFFPPHWLECHMRDLRLSDLHVVCIFFMWSGRSQPRGDFAPQGTFGNVWSQFWLSQLGRDAAGIW